jgi:hypothetical protein
MLMARDEKEPENKCAQLGVVGVENVAIEGIS